MKNHAKLLFIAITVMLLAVIVWGCSDEPEIPLSPVGRVVVTLTGGAGLLPAECGDKIFMTNAADYIVDGRISRIESGWNAGKTSIITFTEVMIGRYVKGESLGVNSLLILTTGGTAGDVTQTTEYQPVFQKQKRVRIYFQKKGGILSVVCGQFGIEAITGRPPQ